MLACVCPGPRFFLQAVVQVPLSGDDRLVFYQNTKTTTTPTSSSVDADGGGGAATPVWVVPTRPAGLCTVHDQYAVHGVMELGPGVRYGLYVLI